MLLTRSATVAALALPVLRTTGATTKKRVNAVNGVNGVK